jgi:hypothetical protein
MDPWKKETNGKRLGIGLFGSPVPICANRIIGDEVLNDAYRCL